MDAPTPNPSATLQFETAEPAPDSAVAAGGKQCSACSTPIRSVYHMKDTAVICPGCRIRLEGGGMTDEGAVTRVLRAAMYGTGAAIAGAVIYGAVITITDMNIGLIAILVGFMVGRGVNLGARGRGGIGYQLMAVGFTYLAIGASLFPIMLRVAHQQQPDMQGGVAVIAAAVLALVGPVAIITSAPINALIYAFGMIQAWRQAKGQELNISGPYHIQSPKPAQAVGTPALG